MKAVVCRRYGEPGVLSLEEAERPIPPDDGVLIRVRAARSLQRTVLLGRGIRSLLEPVPV